MVEQGKLAVSRADGGIVGGDVNTQNFIQALHSGLRV